MDAQVISFLVSSGWTHSTCRHRWCS